MKLLPMLAAALLLGACGESAMGFDKAGWAAERGNYSGKNARNGMVHQLEPAGVKPGASRDAVRALLGEPDSTDTGGDIYYLGRSSVGPSFETYHIVYSPAGVVTSARLERS